MFLHLNLAQAGASNGYACKDTLRVESGSRIKPEFHRVAVTSDAGLIVYREFDEALGLMTMGEIFGESHRSKNTQHELDRLLRQLVYSRLACYEVTHDAVRFAVDPAMRQVIRDQARGREAASTSRMGRFEKKILTIRRNLKSLMDLPGM